MCFVRLKSEISADLYTVSWCLCSVMEKQFSSTFSKVLKGNLDPLKELRATCWGKITRKPRDQGFSSFFPVKHFLWLESPQETQKSWVTLVKEVPAFSLHLCHRCGPGQDSVSTVWKPLLIMRGLRAAPGSDCTRKMTVKGSLLFPSDTTLLPQNLHGISWFLWNSYYSGILA